MRYRRILPVVFVLALGACSGLGRQPTDTLQQSRWAWQQAVAAEVQQWDLYARVVLRLEREVYHVGIRWQRDAGGRFMMLLEAPFGQGVLRIDAIGPEAYELLLPDGQMYASSSAEALLDDAVGWSLPISGLDFWIRGLPHPNGAHALRVDAEGRARSIQQDGWDIVYLDYFDEAGEPALPRRLQLQSGSVAVKLAIERWQPAQTDASNADLFPSFD